jgi:hypothetical protein
MLLLVGTIVALFVVVQPVALWQQGIQGVLESAAAGLLCLLPAIAGLGVSCRLVGTPHALTALILAMAFRMLPPLVVCLLLATQGVGSDFLPFVCYLLLFYAATLAIETYLFVQLIRARN